MEYSESPDGRHSWLVAISGSIAMIFTTGTPISYGIFRSPFTETFEVSPLALSFAFALMLFTYFIGSGFIGFFGLRLPARPIFLACAVLTALLAPSLYFINSLPGLLLVFAFLGGSLGTVLVMVASVVPRWFEKRRGTATGLIFVGNGLGLFILPPTWQIAISRYGVQDSFLIILSVTSLAFFLTGLICRRPKWTVKSTDSVRDISKWFFSIARNRNFILLFLGISLTFAWYQLIAAYAVDLFAHRGMTETAASTAFGLIGGVSIVSRISSGIVGDLFGIRKAFLVSLSAVVLGIFFLFIPFLPILILAILLLGLGLGGTATLYVPLLMRVYSPEKDSAIVGIFNVAIGVSALAMPPIGTASVSYFGNFFIVILLTLVFTILGFWMIVVSTE